MYPGQIKIMDCTVRDGGLMNSWHFNDDFVKAVYRACVEAGIDYMEIGYKSSESAFSRDEVGPWRFCDDSDLQRIVGKNATPLKLSAMADIGRITPEEIPPAKDSVIDMIRVACYNHQIKEAISLAEHCIDSGYETTINLMAVSKLNETDLDSALQALGRCRVPIIYIVDSFGSLYYRNIQHLVKRYRQAFPDKTLGIHAHNNMQLAMSNTISAMMEGCSMLDATLLGMGRGAGNCPIEILVAFLKNPGYRLLPLIKVIQHHIHPLQQELKWGYHIPYLITGALNEHPRSAMKWMGSDQVDDFVSFVKEMQDLQ